MSSANARHGLAVVGVLLLVVAVVVTQNHAVALRAKFPAADDTLYLPRASVLRAVSLGHTELAADLVFIRALIYVGAELSHKGSQRWLENYLDTITQLDPSWKTPYRWAGVATMYNGRTITEADVRLSNHFLELGVRQFPDDWELSFMLACNYLFELHPTDERQKLENRKIGGEWIRHAALVGGAPSWVPLLSATIMRQEGEDEAAVRHLETVYVSTQDERTRNEVRNRLIGLHAKLDLEREARERKAFEQAWHQTLRYAPPDLFVAVGPPAPTRMDLAALSPSAIEAGDNGEAGDNDNGETRADDKAGAAGHTKAAVGKPTAP
ncbi:MAG TPA: hypothetical protein VIA18_15310 [Polyangia bacterium]|jgi:hypothetical protein|nr:hypothetical protein [Polyangia bacterium]